MQKKSLSSSPPRIIGFEIDDVYLLIFYIGLAALVGLPMYGMNNKREKVVCSCTREKEE